LRQSLRANCEEIMENMLFYLFILKNIQTYFVMLFVMLFVI
jgi:hypothetical protein